MEASYTHAIEKGNFKESQRELVTDKLNYLRCVFIETNGYPPLVNSIVKLELEKSNNARQKTTINTENAQIQLNNNNNNNNNNNELISAYQFYMKLALGPKIIYTKRKYYFIKYYEIIS